MDGLNILSENELCHSCQYYYHLCHMYRSLGLVHVLRRSDTEPLTVPALFWTVCFSVIVVVAIIGNCSVLWIVLGKSKFRFPKLEKRWILARSRLKEMLNHYVIPILKCRLQTHNTHRHRYFFKLVGRLLQSWVLRYRPYNTSVTLSMWSSDWDLIFVISSQGDVDGDKLLSSLPDPLRSAHINNELHSFLYLHEKPVSTHHILYCAAYCVSGCESNSRNIRHWSLSQSLSQLTINKT